jgi:hypothetical protein
MDERQKFEIEIKERLIKIEVLLNNEVDNLKRRITKVETNQEWIVRIVIATIVAGALNLLF